MPLDRQPRRSTRSSPKYTFSEDKNGSETSTSPGLSYNPLPTPSPSVTPPPRSSHARKRPPSHIPRPRNAYIIFRSEFCKNEKLSEQGIESDHCRISQIAGHVWNSLEDSQKKPYYQLAEAEKAAHQAAHPDYRYQRNDKSEAPDKSKVPVKRRTKRNDQEDAVRPHQIAELLIAGVKGEALRQAAKDLDQGAVQVKVTKRTSQSASKRLKSPPLHDTHPPSSTTASQLFETVRIKQESPSPPRDLGLPSPHASPSPSLSGLQYPVPSVEAEPQSPVDMPMQSLLSMTEETIALQLAPYSNPTDLLPFPCLDHASQAQSSPSHRIHPSSIGGPTLGELFNPKSSLSSSEALYVPRSLPLEMQDANSALNLPWPESISKISGLPNMLFSLPPNSFQEYLSQADSSSSLDPTTCVSSRKPGVDTERFLSEQVSCYPDDSEVVLNFNEYVHDL